MEVNKTFETPQGTVKFHGELSQDEADYVIKVGLNYLLQNGALPFKVVDNQDTDDVDMEVEEKDD